MVLISPHWALTRLADAFHLITLSLLKLCSLRLLHPHRRVSSHTSGAPRATHLKAGKTHKEHVALQTSEKIFWGGYTLMCTIHALSQNMAAELCKYNIQLHIDKSKHQMFVHLTHIITPLKTHKSYKTYHLLPPFSVVIDFKTLNYYMLYYSNIF